MYYPIGFGQEMVAYSPTSSTTTAYNPTRATYVPLTPPAPAPVPDVSYSAPAPAPSAAPAPSPETAPAPILMAATPVVEEEPVEPIEPVEEDKTGSMLLWGGILLLVVLGGAAVYVYTKNKKD